MLLIEPTNQGIDLISVDLMYLSSDSNHPRLKFLIVTAVYNYVGEMALRHIMWPQFIMQDTQYMWQDVNQCA